MKHIYVTGDTHRKLDISKVKNLGKQHDCEKLIVAGDFGVPFQIGYNNKWSNIDLQTKEMYDNLPFETLFIDGNHENFDFLYRQPITDGYGGKISKISNKITHLKRGEIYEFNGKTIWVFGGATSIDRFMRIEGISWWSQEIPSTKEMNYGLEKLESIDNKVDYIITHTPPEKVIKEIKGDSIDCPVAKYLDHVLDIVEYKKWFCGHMHEDKTIEQYKMRLLYNDVVRLE